MKIMLGKILLLLGCLVGYAVSFAQTPANVRINGVDSISLQITTDTAKKKVYINRKSLKNDSIALADTFYLAGPKLAALKDSAAFFEAIKKFVKLESKEKLADTVNAYLAKSSDFKIEIIQLDGSDTAMQASTGTNVLPVEPDDKSWLTVLLETIPLLIIFILLIVVALALAFFLFFDKKQKSQGREIVLPEELLRIFPGIKKDKDVATTVSRISQAYNALEDELNVQKQNSERAKGQVKELEAQWEKTKNELIAVKLELEKRKDEIANIQKDFEAFNQRAEKILDKYLRDLSMTLEQNKITDKEEVYRLILSRLIAFSMHSASILKKQIKDATELDALNIQWLNGEQPRPKGEITDNTQFGHADPLAYYIYHLLKTHKVEGLREVYVKGYKIGN